jgi:hypothetical protein
VLDLQRDALLAPAWDERHLFDDHPAAAGVIAPVRESTGVPPLGRVPGRLEAGPARPVAAASPATVNDLRTRDIAVPLPHRADGHHHSAR